MRISPRDLAESDDYWGAQAPEVLKEDILQGVFMGLLERGRLYEEAQRVAPIIQEHWTWKAGAEQFVNMMQEKYG